MASAHVAVPPVAGPRCRRARWGTQIDVRVLEPADAADATAIAAYVAKYATKTADGTPWLAHRIRSAAQIERLALRPHLVALVRTAWTLGGRRELRASPPAGPRPHPRLRRAVLLQERPLLDHVQGAARGPRPSTPAGSVEDPFDFDGEWRFAGRGYAHAEADLLARRLHEAARGGSQPCPRSVPRSVPIAMTRENASEKFLVGNPLWNLLSNCLRNLVWRDGAMTNPRRNQQSTGCPQSRGGRRASSLPLLRRLEGDGLDPAELAQLPLSRRDRVAVLTQRARRDERAALSLLVLFEPELESIWRHLVRRGAERRRGRGRRISVAWEVVSGRRDRRPSVGPRSPSSLANAIWTEVRRDAGHRRRTELEHGAVPRAPRRRRRTRTTPSSAGPDSWPPRSPPAW